MALLTRLGKLTSFLEAQASFKLSKQVLNNVLAFLYGCIRHDGNSITDCDELNEICLSLKKGVKSTVRATFAFSVSFFPFASFYYPSNTIQFCFS